MNIATNPWTFTSADVPAAVTIAVSPGGLVQQAALGTVLLTTTGAHGLSAGQWVTIVGTTGGRFLGWYKVLAVPSGTTALLQSISTPTQGSPINTVLAGDGGGNVLVNQYQANVRAEDISIMATATPGATALSLLDRNGLVVWTFLGVATNPGFASQNRGKPMWFDGLTLQSIPTGCIVEITIN